MEVLRDVLTPEQIQEHGDLIIAHLKQAAVEPEDFRERVRKRARPSPMDAVVAEVYAAYQEMLRYWSDPDIELKEIKDAKERLAGLTG